MIRVKVARVKGKRILVERASIGNFGWLRVIEACRDKETKATGVIVNGRKLQCKVT